MHDPGHVHVAVSPRCTPAEVKAAYRGLMRDLHPDLALSSQDEEMKDQAHMLAVLLNEIVSPVCSQCPLLLFQSSEEAVRDRNSAARS